MNTLMSITQEGECLLGKLPLHPSEDPLGAAKQDLQSILKDAGPKDLLVLAGSGLGWHGRAVMEHSPAPMTVIFEPEIRRLAMMRSLGPALPGIPVTQSREQLVDFLGKRLVYGRLSRVAVYSPQAYRMAEPEVLHTAQELVKQTISRSQVDKNTRKLKRSLWWRNLGDNFQQILNLPDLTLLAGALAGVPALVAGAGPSLDDSLPYLHNFRRRCLIMSAASALGPLAGAELSPHLAFALEGKDESRQFAGGDRGKTILAAASSGHPNHFASWPGTKGIFHLDPWVAALAGAGQALPSGGHATSAAFSLAVLWGCDPIVLVGQDLAYTHGRIHAQARPGGEEEERSPQLMVPGIQGELVETSEVMRSYIGWYQEAAAFMQRRFPQTRIINATQSGALLPGFENRPLPEVLAELSDLGDQLEGLGQALSRVPTPRPGPIQERLAQARIQVQNAQKTVMEKGLPTALAEIAPGTAVEAALTGLPDGADVTQALEALQEMLGTLREMGGALYA